MQKAMSAKHRSKFAALSPVMVTAAGELKIAQNKQTNALVRTIERLKSYPSFSISTQSYRPCYAPLIGVFVCLFVCL
jgi:hypothetical protein